MKFGPLDQTRFKSGHQISQTNRLKRRVDLDRRIFCTTNLSHTSSAPIYRPIYRKYRRYIADIFDISAIYLPKNQKKNPRARVSQALTFRPIFRSDSDISLKYRRYFPIFLDFSCKRFSVSKIVSFTPNIRYITDISADISEISILGYRYHPCLVPVPRCDSTQKWKNSPFFVHLSSIILFYSILHQKPTWNPSQQLHKHF